MIIHCACVRLDLAQSRKEMFQYLYSPNVTTITKAYQDSNPQGSTNALGVWASPTAMIAKRQAARKRLRSNPVPQQFR